MEHQTQIVQAHRILDYIDNRTTTMAAAVYRNPVRDYICPEQFRREMQVFFRESPLLMGLSCEVSEPGSYISDDFSGVPIVVVRNDDGDLNAFMNVCRHRGARLAAGCGKIKKAFVCPYHAWSYDRNGRLVGLPHGESFESVDRDTHGLRRLPIIEKHGLIWVRPTPGDGFDSSDHLGGLEDDLRAYGLEDYHHYETRVLQPRMNWKLVVDTFLETYHLNVLHRKTIDPILFSNLAAFDGFGRNLRMIVARRSFGELRDQPEGEWDLIKHSTIVNVLFPNTVFLMQGDHLETWRVYPANDSADEARMHVSLYTPEPTLTESARRHWDRNMDLLLDTVESEDFPVGEDIQRGFHSGAQEHITFGRNEPALGHYHGAIKAALGITE